MILKLHNKFIPIWNKCQHAIDTSLSSGLRCPRIKHFAFHSRRNCILHGNLPLAGQPVRIRAESSFIFPESFVTWMQRESLGGDSGAPLPTIQLWISFIRNTPTDRGRNGKGRVESPLLSAANTTKTSMRMQGAYTEQGGEQVCTCILNGTWRGWEIIYSLSSYR